MLIVMMAFIVIIASSMLLLKRNKETSYLFFMCVSLFMLLLGTFIYIAKKGGISKELQSFYFINDAIKYKFQYMFIQLNHLGFLMAIGRYLFPMFLLLLALHYCNHPFVKGKRWMRYLAIIIPVMTLLIYYPPIFRFITEKNVFLQQVMINVTLAWITLFLILAVMLLIIELRAIQLQIFQRNFLLIMTFIISLVTLYLLYYLQDPAHVYRFYGTYLTLTGKLFYMKPVVSVQLYIAIVCVNIIAAIVGFASMYRYTQATFMSMRHGEIIKYQTEAVTTSTSTFVHGIKNQLLANQIIHKRINRLTQTEAITETLQEQINQLEKQNNLLLQRMDDLRQTIQTNQVHLKAQSLSTILQASLKGVKQAGINEGVTWDIRLDDRLIVLADKQHLTEVLHNLLVNALEAIEEQAKQAETYKGKIKVKTYQSRMYHVIEIADNGIGMTEKELSRIDEPFYSRKNSTNNWGMGLYYARKIIEEHFGLLRFESKRKVGSTFYIFLPRYRQ